MSTSEERLVAILDGIGECFYALDREWRITVFNRGAESFFGRDRSEMIGRVVWDVLDVRGVPGLETAYREAMEGTVSPRREIPSPARPGRWLEGGVFPLPDGIGVAFRDVTERRADVDALRRREAELARVQRIAGVGGLEVEFAEGYDNRRSPEYLVLHGLPPEAATEAHEDWVRRIHPNDRERTERDFKDAVKGADVSYAAEYRIVRPSDGQVRWIAATAEIERDASGRAIRLVGAHRDVTDRYEHQERQRLLINELNHRVKNTLATVQSIAAQSLRNAADPAHAWPAFESRLMALSRAHDVLTRESWAGADLATIVADAIAPYRGGAGERIVAEGGPVRLRPHTALALAMALQELATNAAKYGALSNPDGVVRIAWEMNATGQLRLSWMESGGPAVMPPTRRGFGSRLIEQGLARDLGGSAEMMFLPAGLVCVIEASPADLGEGDEVPGSTSADRPPVP